MKKLLVFDAMAAIIFLVVSCVPESVVPELAVPESAENAVFLEASEDLPEETHEMSADSPQESDIICSRDIFKNYFGTEAPYPFFGLNSLIGFKDEYGEVVIEAQYYDTNGFFDGLAFVMGVEGREYQTGFIDAAGNLVVLLPTAIFGERFSEGFAHVVIREWYCEYEQELVHGLSGPYVFINMEGENIFNQEFLDARPFSEGFARVMLSNGRITFIDTTGENAFGMEFMLAGCFFHGYANVKLIDGRYTHIDREGNIVDIDRIWGQWHWEGDVMIPATHDNPPTWWSQMD